MPTYLVSHPGVDKVTFTGSTAVGRQIAATCGDLLRPVTLELGGKSAAIILGDADLMSNLEGLFQIALLKQRANLCCQRTHPRTALTVQETLGVLCALVSGASVGDPLDPQTQIGPLVSRAIVQPCRGLHRQGRRRVPDSSRGGGRPRELAKGWFVKAHAVRGCRPRKHDRPGDLRACARRDPVRRRRRRSSDRQQHEVRSRGHYLDLGREAPRRRT